MKTCPNPFFAEIENSSNHHHLPVKAPRQVGHHRGHETDYEGVRNGQPGDRVKNKFWRRSYKTRFLHMF
jgi:hypothetical protein